MVGKTRIWPARLSPLVRVAKHQRDYVVQYANDKLLKTDFEEVQFRVCGLSFILNNPEVL